MELSRPNLVEACDMGVVGGDDIASHLPWANAHAQGNEVWGTRRKRGLAGQLRYLPSQQGWADGGRRR